VSSTAFAQQSIGPGLSYFSSNGYHVVEADLDSDSVEVRVARPHPTDTADMITTASHAAEEGATVAINANYFGGPLNHPCGAGRGFGHQFTDAYAEAVNCETTLGWSKGIGAVFDTLNHEADSGFHTEYPDEVTGGGWLVQNGKPHDWNHAKLEEGRDCTAVGISGDRKKFIFVVTDSTSCTGAGLQSTLIAHGAADAIHLDGGGSSKMWIRGMGYVNDEVEDRMPPVVVMARPRGDCPSDCGAAPCVQLDLPFRAQCVGQICRAGLGSIWNCDVAHLRRAHCDANGNVQEEYCAMGCVSQPNGQDDTCTGGAIPEPTPDMSASGGGSDGGSGSSGGGSDAAAGSGGDDDGGVGSGPGGGDPSGASSSGCTLSGRASPGAELIFLVGLLVLMARGLRHVTDGGPWPARSTRSPGHSRSSVADTRHHPGGTQLPDSSAAATCATASASWAPTGSSCARKTRRSASTMRTWARWSRSTRPAAPTKSPRRSPR
jgi:hypothetical protein